MTSLEGYYLIAHCINATNTQRAEVELEVASESIEGRWFTNDGIEVWPFWQQPIEFPTPAIPEGWIEHLHTVASRIRPAPTQSLTDLLGLRKPKPNLPTTPIARRF